MGLDVVDHENRSCTLLSLSSLPLLHGPPGQFQDSAGNQLDDLVELAVGGLFDDASFIDYWSMSEFGNG